MTSGKNKKNKDLILKVLDWSYSKALSGYMGADSAYELGDSFLKQKGKLDEQVDKLIKWQISKAATSGFLTGIGGFAIMPFSIPANVASVIYIQIRMISAIAYMGGYDLKDDRVKTMVYISMVGNGAKEILKDMGIKMGERFLVHIAQNASVKVLNSINEKTATSVITQIGNRSLSKMGKAIPLMGGIISGAFDATTTNIIGKVAKKIFIENPPPNAESEL